MTHPVTTAYLDHLLSTGLVTGFRIDDPCRPHDSMAAARDAIVAGALPDDPAASELRRMHGQDVDDAELDAFLTWAPPWARALLLVPDTNRTPGDQATRYQTVRKALARWRTNL